MATKLQIVTNAQSAINSLSKLKETTKQAKDETKKFREENEKNNKKLKETAPSFDKATDKTKEFTEKTSESNKKLKETAPSFDKASNSAKKYGTSLQGVSDILKSSSIIGFMGTIKNVWQSMEKAIVPQSEYIENLNFLNEAYNHNAESGERLLSSIENLVGFDQAGLTRSLANYRQLGNALNIDDEYANMLAENLLKIAIDTKSLTGDSLDTVTNRFASAMAGNSRAVRAYGVDITIAGLQQEALNLGIEKEVSSMTRAEKSILTYITMAKQLTSANGDMAKTVNSVANQYEIFKSQISETGRLLGGFLIPIMRAVLPVVNGVLMAINVLLQTLLSLFGIDASSLSEEFGSFAGEIEDLADDFGDVSTGATDAGNSIKNAQKSLRGWDKLNVIQTPTPTSGAGGGGVSVGGSVGGLGIDKSLLEKLGEYDLHLDSISNKATEIRDSIMEWLGFEKIIDPITGEISWKYQGIQKTIKNVVEWFSKLPWYGKIFVGLGVFKVFSDIYKTAKKLFDLIGKTKIGKFLDSNLVKPFKELFKLISSKGIIEGFDDWSVNSIDKTQRLTIALAGAGGLIAGLNMTRDAVKDLIENGDSLGSELEYLGGVLSGAGGGFLTGASIGGFWTGVAGMVIGAIASILSAIGSIEQESNATAEVLESKVKSVRDFTAQMQEDFNAIEEKASQDMTKVMTVEKLVEQLEKITEANGKVKKGYEDQANFIVHELNEAYDLNIKMIDGQIQEYDKVLTSIKKLIETEKARIYQEMAKEKYTEALKQEAELNEKIAEVAGLKIKSDMLSLQYEKKYNEARASGNKQAMKEAKELRAEYQEALSAWAEADADLNKAMELNSQAQADYFGITTAIIDGDEKAMRESINKIMAHQNNMSNNMAENYTTMSSLAAKYWDERINLYGKKYEELSETEKAFADEYLDIFVGMMEEEYNELGTFSDEQVQAWGRLSELSSEAYYHGMQKLPKNMKDDLAPKMKAFFKDSLDYVKYEAKNAGNITIPVKLGLVDSIKSFANNIKNQLNSAFATKATGGLYSSGIWRPMKQYASGGFPTSGEMFIAREKGPELVGKIGNSTAVMNNDQILDQMTIAVARGISASNQQETPINIVAEGDMEGLMNFITFKQKQNKRQYGL